MTNINALNPAGTARTTRIAPGRPDLARADQPGTASPVAPGGPDREARLRQVADQLQGVFVEQLFKAMRETVPEGGITSGGSGEQMFTGLLDQHLANAVPSQWSRGIGESLMRQLRSQLALAAPASGTDAIGAPVPGATAAATAEASR